MIKNAKESITNTKVLSSKKEFDDLKEDLNWEQVIQWLKSILATTVVLTYKLSQFHWNMKWDKFLYIHPKFWDLYVSVFEQQDSIAERIRQLLWKASVSLKDSIELSVIDENEDNSISPNEALTTSLQDFKDFLLLLDIFADRLWKDLSTQQLIIDLQMFYSQQIFLFESEL